MNLVATPAHLSTVSSTFEQDFSQRLHWSMEQDAAIEERVAAILADVQQRGDAAVLERAVQAAAAIAVQAVAALPPLGFIHEDSGQSFVLDIADLYRETATLHIAFTAAKQAEKSDETIDRLVRREAATVFRKQQVIASMIDSIQRVLRMDEVDHGTGDDRDS